MTNNDNLIAREPELKGLSLALNAKALSAQTGFDLRFERLRYKPGTSLNATYRDEAGKWWVAVAYTKSHFKEMLNRKHWAEQVIFLPNDQLALIPAQLDRKLERISTAIRLLQRAHPELDIASLQPFSYRHSRRLVMRADNSIGQPVGFAKLYSPDLFLPALAGTLAGQLHEGPAVTAVIERSRLILTEWINGTALTDSNTDHFQAGQLLASLHQGKFRSFVSQYRAQEITTVTAIANHIIAIMPEQANAIRDLAHTLAACLAAYPAQYHFIHGDFSPDQILRRGEQLILTDWDRALQADIAHDLGCYLASLPLENNTLARDAFLNGYGALPPATAALETYHLFKRLDEPFRLQRPDWPRSMLNMMDKMTKLLTSLQKADASMPAIANTLHSPDQWLSGNSTATTATLQRHKKGRRALIKIANAQQAVWVKFRAKGVDKRLVSLHQRLRDAGLSGQGKDRIAVSQVLSTDFIAKAWSMPEAEGTQLTSLLTPDSSITASTQAGFVLAALHQSNVKVDRHWSLTDEAAVLYKALQQSLAAHPEEAAAHAQLRERAEYLLASLQACAPCLIHRDFYPDQIIIGQQTTLLDLDLASMGNPAIDLSNFTAHLKEAGLREWQDSEALAPHISAFLNAYASRSPLPDSQTLQALEWISLARHVWISERIATRRDTRALLLDYLMTTPYST